MNTKGVKFPLLRRCLEFLCFWKAKTVDHPSNPFDTPDFIQKVTSAMHKTSGLWFQVLDDGTEATYPIVRTPEYLALYGYAEEGKLPLLNVKKQHRPKVINVLKQAQQLENLGHMFDCTVQIRTKGGTEIWVHVFVQQLELRHYIKGKERTVRVMASLHVDVTEMYMFYEQVLDTVPGFVFVKEVTDDKIIFRYANKELVARLLGKTLKEVQPNDREKVLGKSDRDFLGDSQQTEHFEETDRRVHETHERIFLAEETFTPKTSGSEAIRLATVKVPFETSRWSMEPRQYVLGIALDITHITKLLRLVMAESRDGIYVKTRDGKFVTNNAAFAKLIGEPANSILENKTLGDILRKRPEYGMHKKEWEERIRIVEQEDRDLTDTHPITTMRRAIFSDQRTWHIQKQFVRHADSEDGVILGIAQDIFHINRVDQAIVNRMTQCACIKDAKLELVWCNEAYARYYGKLPDQLLGKTAFHLYPDSDIQRQQTDYERRDDIELLKLARQHEAHYSAEEFTRAAESEQKMAQYLRMELEQPKDGDHADVRKLLVSRRAQKIYGDWYIVTVFSDVTEMLDRLLCYHKFTVHSIRNQFTPFSRAQSILERLLSLGYTNLPEIKAAKSNLKRGNEVFEFITNCLLKFLHGHADLVPTSLGQVNNIISERATWTRDVENEIKVNVSTTAEFDESLFIETDGDLLAVVVMELLKNAATAILDRHRLEDVRFESGIIDIVIRIDFLTRHLCVEVNDNGDSAVSEAKRRAFTMRWEAARQAALAGAHREMRTHFGLFFVHDSVQKLKGVVTLCYPSGRTSIQLHFPISKYHLNNL